MLLCRKYKNKGKNIDIQCIALSTKLAQNSTKQHKNIRKTFFYCFSGNSAEDCAILCYNNQFIYKDIMKINMHSTKAQLFSLLTAGSHFKNNKK